MKAVLCKKHGPPESLVLEEVQSLVPEKDEVIITVKACGLNFPDTLIIEGKYQFQPEMPFSPGGEVAGVIKEVGSEVKAFKKGDRVMAGTSWGGFAEEVRTKPANVFKIPNTMDFETAAASMMTYGTSYHALVDRARIKKGETLLVLGAAGGVGTAAIQIGKKLGATVIAAASSEDKLAYCRSMGADLTVNYATEDLKSRVKELTDGKGADVIYDPVGAGYTEPAFRAIARGGRHLVVGFAAGNIPSLLLNLVLLKSASVVGVFWGGFFRNEPEANRKNFDQLLQWFSEGAIKTHIDKRLPLKDWALAMNLMTSRKVLGKIILIP